MTNDDNLDLIGARQAADVACRNMWRMFYEEGLSEYCTEREFANAAADALNLGKHISSIITMESSSPIQRFSMADAIYWEGVFKKISAAINTKAEWIENLKNI